MGVLGLWELLAPVGRRVSVETLAGKRLAIDASIWMTKQVSVFDGGTPALKRRTVIRVVASVRTLKRKSGKPLRNCCLIESLKEMRLKEQPNDLKKQRLQQSKSAGDKKRVFSVSLEEPLRDSADEDGAGGSCFQEEKMDEISSASVAGETVNDFATKGSSVTIEKIQGGIDIRSILSKEDIFRSLPSNDYLEGFNEDIMFLGMHTSQFLQQRTGIDDQIERGETLTPLLNM
ncbi:hypothetical protein IGI04_041038 [Brassica rapa subsp. trilocularis]|uniref:XPG N-terminal domain-containing protein n=1 Tax=Brassica rapa subsp. trilocularis TaxID=1813537 RepID=A0ABQ7KQ92_BRACM|nr:hypothetical protein IGI04_041038 [Brassica rapa subsp. trilocularis]